MTTWETKVQEVLVEFDLAGRDDNKKLMASVALDQALNQIKAITNEEIVGEDYFLKPRQTSQDVRRSMALGSNELRAEQRKELGL